MKGKLVLIGGVSRCGKSTLANELSQLLPSSIHLDQDDFVIEEQLIPKIKDRIDWETPESIDWPKLHNEIDRSLSTNNLVIVEGIFAFTQKDLTQKAQFRIALQAQKENFLKWRKEETRWGNEPDWYLEHVWNSHLVYHNPHQIKFDIETEYSVRLAEQIAKTIL